MISLSDMILDNQPDAASGPLTFHRRKKPDWLRAKLPGGKGYTHLHQLMRTHGLHTVCESAKCPNLGECWNRGTATLMILGDVCTRSCGFCHIETGRPPTLDRDEPRRVGEAAAIMRLKHLVITSVNRDELDDGGASIWAATIREVRKQSPGTSIEVLIPDFEGNWDALQLVIDERPEILNHNMETVKRLYSVVRPQAKYERSIELLHRAKAQGLVTKTGIMVGIGERDEEIEELMGDVLGLTGSRRSKVESRKSGRQTSNVECRTSEEVDCPPANGEFHGERSAEGLSTFDSRLSTSNIGLSTSPPVDILTIGQYLQPTRDHLPISRWVTPAQFVEYKRLGESMGFRHVESGPLVRSSYHAEEQVLHLEKPVDE